MKDHYKTLGIDETADKNDIKRAYFSLVKQFPPSRFPEQYKTVRQAYEVLSNEKARADYDEVQALLGQAIYFYQAAQKAESEGKLDEACKIYEDILKFYPDLIGVRKKYAETLYRLGKIGKSATQWKKLCASQPDNPAYIMALAESYDRRGWDKKATETYWRVLELDGTNAYAWLAIIRYHEKTDEDMAANICRQALESFKKAGKESIVIYLQAISLFGKEKFDLYETYVKGIARLVRAGDNDIIIGTNDLIQTFISMADKQAEIRLIPYIFDMADTLPEIDSELRLQLDNMRFVQTMSTLKDKGFDVNILNLLASVADLATYADDMDLKLDIASYEFEILDKIKEYRPMIVRLRDEYPEIYDIHASFFSRALRPNELDKMMNERWRLFQSQDSYPTYLDDEQAPVQQPVRREGPKVGRNDPCPCGSGKKYKKCCGA